MARPPKPIEVLNMQGTSRRDRHAGRECEPQSGGLPVKPAWLKGVAADFWDEVIELVTKMNIAQSVDSSSLAGMCRWWAEWRRLDRRLEELGDTDDAYKLIIQAGLAWKHFDKMASKFGFTPVDRTKLGKPKEEKKSALLEMLKNRERLN